MVAALKRVVAATVLLLLGGGVAVAQSDAERQRAKDAIVMIRTQLPGGTQMGAGIIVAVTQREVYVATANHMVRRGGVASSIELQFASTPGRWVTATLLDFRDADLDLAAVVAQLPQNFSAASLRNVLSAPPQQLRREMDVFALGYPRERAWNLPVLADKIASITSSRIVFQSNYVQPGNSGGALLDGCGRIVGMVIETDPPEATAVRIESVLDAVRSWNLPAQPSLTTASNACGGAILPPAAPVKDVTVTEVAPAPAPQTRPTPAAPARPATTDVTLSYLGDQYACVLQLQVKIGNATAVPTSNFFKMHNVPLGRQDYTINGQIGCVQLGSCIARGQGTLNVEEDDTYNVVWGNSAIGQCQVTLVKP